MHNELEVNFHSCTMAPVSNTCITGLFSITEIPLLRGDCSAEQMLKGQDLNLYLHYLLTLFCRKPPCMAKLTGNIVMCMCNAVSVKRTEKSLSVFTDWFKDFWERKLKCLPIQKYRCRDLARCISLHELPSQTKSLKMHYARADIAEHIT